MSDSNIDPQEQVASRKKGEASSEKLNKRIGQLRFLVVLYTILIIPVFASSILQVVSSIMANTMFKSDTMTTFYWTWTAIAFLCGVRTYCVMLHKELVAQRIGTTSTQHPPSKVD